MSHQELAYAERYVAFIDILGFSEIVRETRINPSLIAEIERALRNVHAKIADDRIFSDELRALTFSDCIIISEEFSPPGLRNLLNATTNLALSLLSLGMMTRGAVVKGLLYHNEQMVFGPAMLEAYRLESTIANTPRILVDRKVYDDNKSDVARSVLRFARSRGEGITVIDGAAIKRALDGPPFVDILSVFRGPPSDRFGDAHRAVRESLRATCQAAVQRRLNEAMFNPHHYSKLRWFAEYWNEAMKDGRVWDSTDLIDFNS